MDLPGEHRFLRAATLLALALPWLWPFAPGPSPNVVPVLAAWCCWSAALVLSSWGGVPAAWAAPRAWVAAALASSLIGLLQWFGAAPHTSWISSADIGQAYGNLRQRNQFATLTAIGLAALVWCRPLRGRAWTAVAVALLAFANAASASRTGAIEWVALLLLAAAWPGDRRQRVQWCAVGLILYMVATFLLPLLLLQWRGVDAVNVLARATSELGCSSRKVLWSNVVELILERPWTGWGWGELDFAHFSTLYPGARFCDILDNAHNLPLHLAVELGIPAAAVAIGLLVAIVWRAAPWREAESARQLAWCVLLVVGLHSLLEYPLWYGPFQVAAILCLQLLRPATAVVLTRGRIVMIAVSIIAAAGFIWADYQSVSQAFLAPEQRWADYRADPVRRAGHSVLFEPQLRFAELSVTPLSRANAVDVQRLARELLHYSPEPMVAERLIESSLLVGDQETATWAAARYRAAFPDAYQAWLQRQAGRAGS
ncbi:polymerase [Ramlibacter humi]|uniref:Polymerase n=2 Tax=Ramlibacter humi TaxID=2530451 RepID=A0A4Z0BVQ1_9BURK|nr:polymerase [Ramlibacter humi]